MINMHLRIDSEATKDIQALLWGTAHNAFAIAYTHLHKCRCTDVFPLVCIVLNAAATDHRLVSIHLHPSPLASLKGVALINYSVLAFRNLCPFE